MPRPPGRGVDDVVAARPLTMSRSFACPRWKMVTVAGEAEDRDAAGVTGDDERRRRRWCR